MKQRTRIPRKIATPRRKALWVQIEEEKNLCTIAPIADKPALVTAKTYGMIRPQKRASTSAKTSMTKTNTMRNADFADKRSHITAHGRVRLFGKDMEALRRRKFEDAGGKCERKIYCQLPECQPNWHELRYCGKPAPWEESVFTRGHLAHRQHGPRKTDTIKGTLWSCAECHFREHGPQFRKERMSRALTEEQFVNYYAGEHCLCQNDKPERSALCAGCREVLAATNPALLHVIENGTDEPLYQALGEFRDLVRKANEEV